MSKPKNLFRQSFVTKIGHLLQQAADASGVEHPGLTGTIREIVVSKLLEPVLPPEVRCGTGKLTDINGELTDQIDVVLYSPGILPPSLYDERNGVFPIESALYTIEVKSTLTAKTLHDAVENARSIRRLRLLPTMHWVAGEGKRGATALPILSLFAFDSDLAGTGKTELDRYREMDPQADQEPAIGVMCVRGKGYWYHVREKEVSWKRSAPTDAFDEVLDFLAGLTNTIPRLLSVKGRPNFGHYLGSRRGFENA